MFPFLTSSLKWWYLIFRCFVLGLILGTFAISIAPELSSKTVHLIFGFPLWNLNPWSVASCSNHMMGITSLIDCERAMYSASVDDSAISVCILDAQWMGHPACVMMYPILDLAVFGSSIAPSQQTIPPNFGVSPLNLGGWARTCRCTPPNPHSLGGTARAWRKRRKTSVRSRTALVRCASGFEPEKVSIWKVMFLTS